MRSSIMAILAACSLLWACERNEEAPEPEETSKVSEPETGRTTRPTDQMTGPMMGRLRSACPMAIDSVEVSVSDTDNGVALTFKTGEANLDELRQRTQHLAQMYEMHRGRPMMWRHMRGMGRGQGVGMGPGPGRGPMPEAQAEVTEIDEGVRLELTPNDPSQLRQLRDQARFHQQRMQSGACWIWSDGPQKESER